MSEDEGIRALNRLKATRAGNRGVATKLVKSIDELLDNPTTDHDQAQCETLYELLEDKFKTLSTLDEQILERIEIEAIEVTRRIINARKTLKLYSSKTSLLNLLQKQTQKIVTIRRLKKPQILPIQIVLHRQARKPREKTTTTRGCNACSEEHEHECCKYAK